MPAGKSTHMNILKSIGTVIAGFVVVAVLSVATDFILESAGIFPPQTTPEAYVPWMLMLALFYRSAYTVAGGYIVAWLAPTNPWRHVYALMVLGGIGGVMGAIGGWNLGNHWYPVLLAITGPLFVWLGGALRLSTHKG